LVWSVLGPDKLRNYQQLLENTKDRIPGTEKSTHVEYFHYGVGVLKEVHAMHDEVRRACSRSDYIISELIPIIEDMLAENPKTRPNAKRVRKRCRQALDRVSRLLATEDTRDLDIDRSYVGSSIARVAELEKLSQRDSEANDATERRRKVEITGNQASDDDQTQYAELRRATESITVSLVCTQSKSLR
jgi:hypothetical protein